MSVRWNDVNDSTTSLRQIYLPLLEQNDCTPPKCGELSKYTESAHPEMGDISSRCMNGSDEYDGRWRDTRQFHPS